MESQNKPERGNALWKGTCCTPAATRTNPQENLLKGLWCGCWDLSTNCFGPAILDSALI